MCGWVNYKCISVDKMRQARVVKVFKNINHGIIYDLIICQLQITVVRLT